MIRAGETCLFLQSNKGAVEKDSTFWVRCNEYVISKNDNTIHRAFHRSLAGKVILFLSLVARSGPQTEFVDRENLGLKKLMAKGGKFNIIFYILRSPYVPYDMYDP